MHIISYLIRRGVVLVRSCCLVHWLVNCDMDNGLAAAFGLSMDPFEGCTNNRLKEGERKVVWVSYKLKNLLAIRGRMINQVYVGIPGNLIRSPSWCTFSTASNSVDWKIEKGWIWLLPRFIWVVVGLPICPDLYRSELNRSPDRIGHEFFSKKKENVIDVTLLDICALRRERLDRLLLRSIMLSKDWTFPRPPSPTLMTYLAGYLFDDYL